MHLHRWLGIAVLAAALGTSHAQQVVRVQPSASEVPANLLRISIVFAVPVEGAVLPRIALLHADGTLIEDPFLQQELWSPSGRILTVLMHPGRVKTGLNARERLGPFLTTGEDVTLALDGRAIKRWKVGPADSSGPVASEWKLSRVRAGSRQALAVALDGPIDGRDVDHLAVADAGGRRVFGRARLKGGESTWIFTPDRPWLAGRYKLVVKRTLEDPAGNRLGGSFETPVNAPPAPAAVAVVAFSTARSLSPAGAYSAGGTPAKSCCVN
jgi:hypothetical protein